MTGLPGPTRARTGGRAESASAAAKPPPVLRYLAAPQQSSAAMPGPGCPRAAALRWEPITRHARPAQRLRARARWRGPACVLLPTSRAGLHARAAVDARARHPFADRRAAGPLPLVVRIFGRLHFRNRCPHVYTRTKAVIVRQCKGPPVQCVHYWPVRELRPMAEPMGDECFMRVFIFLIIDLNVTIVTNGAKINQICTGIRF